MLVQNSVYRNTYLTDGVNKDFYFSFPILEASQVLVQTSLLTDTETVTTVDPGQYTVIGVGQTTGGHISFTTAPPTGSRLALTLNIPITQLYQYAELDSFPAKSHEDALAKLTLICQQLKEQLERAVMLPSTSNDSPEVVVASIYASRDAAAASAGTASNKADAAEVSAQAAADSAATAAQAVEAATADAVAVATVQANAAHDSALAAAQSAAEAEAAAPDTLVWRVEQVEEKTQPATTTSRGIARVATLADMEPDAEVENGPAVLAAGSEALNALVPTFLIGSIISTYAADGYVPNGCVPPDGAEYTESQFPTFYTGYLTAGRVVTCTYTEFAAQVALTGNCGKFALDTVNQKFKVPLLKDGDSITHAASAVEIGKSVKAGLPNITGKQRPSLGPGGGDTTGAFVLVASSGYTTSSGAGGTVFNTVDFDASKSNAIYGNSSSVTDEQVRLRHFVVLASAQNNSSMFDWSNYMAALAGKANNDLSNVDLSKANIVLQQVRVETGALATGTGSMPSETDSIPTSTNGTQFMAATITPKSANSKLVVDAVFNGAAAANPTTIGVALYRDGATNAIASATGREYSAHIPLQVVLHHSLTSGSTAPTTFKVRAGVPGGETITFNGANGVRRGGGSNLSSITITEYAA